MSGIDDDLRRLAGEIGPFTSVSFDAGRASESAAEEIALRVRALSEELERSGAPRGDVAVLREASRSPAGAAGDITRVVIAREGAVVLDVVLPGYPVRDECAFGPAPYLVPVARARRFPAPYLVVDVDRAGADIEVVGELGTVADVAEVTGSQDVLHKVREGGWSHRRMQRRAEDSWERNAAEIAREIDRLVADVRPQAVLVDGDPYATSAMIDALTGATSELVTQLQSGGRAAGVHPEAHRQAIDRALAAQYRRGLSALLGRFAQAEARQEQAVQGLAAVADSARRTQVGTLLLLDRPFSTVSLWSGPAPFQIGAARDEVTAMGVDEPRRMGKDAILSRAVYAAGGEVVVLTDDDLAAWDGGSASTPNLTDGVGALLRWSDPGTPHDAAPAMPGHGGQPGP